MPRKNEGNNQTEQNFINEYYEKKLKPKEGKIKIFNKSCQGRGNANYADLEYYDAEENVYWVFEVKTANSTDKQNAVHKIFGEFLKEISILRLEKRKSRIEKEIENFNGKIKYGLLIEDDDNFFHNKIKDYNERVFKAFGSLIPISKVVQVNKKFEIKEFTWEGFYLEG